MSIGSVLMEGRGAFGFGMYEVGHPYYIGVLDKNDKMEIKDCRLLEIFDDGTASISLDNYSEGLRVKLDILQAKKRWVNYAIKIS